MNATLSPLDWFVLVTYFAALLALSLYLGQGQESEDDYYVGGRDLPWWAVGISTAATQTSAIGFMSIPAFIAMKQGGGLRLLQQELVVPLALLFVMVFFLPFFRKLELISAYEYLQMRFSPAVRYLIASVFLLNRGIGTAVVLYMSAIVFSTVFQLSLAGTVFVIGGLTVVYDAIGGIKAVVYSDVIQMGVLLTGAGLIVSYASSEVGGLGAAFTALAASDPARVQVIELAGHGFGDGATFSLLPQLVGGFFLLVSYYGCDQTQTQRELAASSLDETRMSLVFNAFFRFPLALLYGAVGVSMGAYVTSHPAFVERVMALGSADYMLPLFLMEEVPQGVRALIFVAALAAAMSSLDSAVNSLSASTSRDFLDPLWLAGKDPAERPDPLRVSKVTTIVWGAAITFGALFVGGIADTVIEAIGKVASLFNGPIVASFFAGVACWWITPQAILLGVLAGVGANLALFLGRPDVFWMWWNVVGFVVAMGVADLASRLLWPAPESERLNPYVLWNSGVLADERRWLPAHAGMVVYAALMLALCWAAPGWLL